MNFFEFGLLEKMHDALQCGFLDCVMPWITKLGDKGIFCIAVAVLLLCFKRTRRAGLMLGIALLCGVLCGNLCLKNLVARTRPYDLPGVHVSLLVDVLHDYAFPSGHTLACFEMATVLLMTHRKSMAGFGNCTERCFFQIVSFCPLSDRCARGDFARCSIWYGWGISGGVAGPLAANKAAAVPSSKTQ